jgi:isopropylmalate/homocitrate/citramalate synthase
MELFADGLGERAGNVAIVEIQNVDGEENKS